MRAVSHPKAKKVDWLNAFQSLSHPPHPATMKEKDHASMLPPAYPNQKYDSEANILNAELNEPDVKKAAEKNGFSAVASPARLPSYESDQELIQTGRSNRLSQLKTPLSPRAASPGGSELSPTSRPTYSSGLPPKVCVHAFDLKMLFKFSCTFHSHLVRLPVLQRFALARQMPRSEI